MPFLAQLDRLSGRGAPYLGDLNQTWIPAADDGLHYKLYNLPDRAETPFAIVDGATRQFKLVDQDVGKIGLYEPKRWAQILNPQRCTCKNIPGPRAPISGAINNQMKS